MIKRKALFLPLIFALCALLWNAGVPWYWRMHPEKAFGVITGRSLPKGVQATAYASEVADNFFHRTHYWTLSGPPELLQEVITSHHFQQSEDAAWSKPDVGRLFEKVMNKAHLATGYEREESGRNRWFWLSLDKSIALYAY